MRYVYLKDTQDTRGFVIVLPYCYDIIINTMIGTARFSRLKIQFTISFSSMLLNYFWVCKFYPNTCRSTHLKLKKSHDINQKMVK